MTRAAPFMGRIPKGRGTLLLNRLGSCGITVESVLQVSWEFTISGVAREIANEMAPCCPFYFITRSEIHGMAIAARELSPTVLPNAPSRHGMDDLSSPVAYEVSA